MQTPPGSPTSASDEALATEAAGGSRGAFAALVERYGARVLAAVERSVQDHHLARDLAQEVWIKVHRGLAGFDPDRRFRPWLFAVACNHVRDARRRGSRAALHLLEDGPALDPPSEGPDPSRVEEEREAIEVALARVPEPFRTAVHLVDVLGLGYQEAAESLGCSIGTSKSRVHRGRVAFRDAYLQSTSAGAAGRTRG